MFQIISEQLLIHEIIHGLFASLFGFLLWKKTKSWKRGLLVVLLAYVQDIDHLVDYFLFYGLHISIPKFFLADYFQITKRAVVPYHAWEWLAILGFLGYKRGWKSNFTLLFMALLPHLIIDSLNVGSFTFYSITYRIIKGFRNLN